MKKVNVILVIALSFIALHSCSRQVTRMDPSTQTDISGRWNDTDSRQVAETMISDVLSGGWLTRFSAQNNGKAPVVIVSTITNKSTEHIPSETFIKDVERAFINSGKVRIVENDLFREKIREELGNQQSFASDETRKKIAQELGADFIMFGTINSIVDQYKKEKTVAYKVNLELANLQTTEKVWIGDKEIKKYIKN